MEETCPSGEVTPHISARPFLPSEAQPFEAVPVNFAPLSEFVEDQPIVAENLAIVLAAPLASSHGENRVSVPSRVLCPRSEVRFFRGRRG